MEDAGHTIDGGTRGETEAVKAAIEKSEEDEQNGDKEDEKPDLKRKGTMQETIEVGNLTLQSCFGYRLTFVLKYSVFILFAIVTWKFDVCK